MDLTLKTKTYFDEAMQMVTQLGIPVGKITDVSVNSRFINIWGRCDKNSDKKSFRIQISRKLMEEGTRDGILDTMIHEILHTCPRCFNHQGLWKKYAQMIYEKYGIDVKRTTSCEEKGMPAYQPKYKYTIRCTSCGREFKYKKRCFVVEHYSLYCCDHCRGKLELCETKEA